LISTKILLVVLLQLGKANNDLNLVDGSFLERTYSENDEACLRLTIIHKITPVLVSHSLTSISLTDRRNEQKTCLEDVTNALEGTRLGQLVTWSLQLSDLRMRTDATKLSQHIPQQSSINLPPL